MKLSPRKVDELLLHNAGFLAQKPLVCGLRLNYTEAVALIASQILAIVREGEKTGRIDGHQETTFGKGTELPTYRVEIRRQVLLAVLHPLDNVQVIDYYAKKNVLAQLHAEQPPKEVSAEVQKALS